MEKETRLSKRERRNGMEENVEVKRRKQKSRKISKTMIKYETNVGMVIKNKNMNIL